jgi:hypothetical protein
VLAGLETIKAIFARNVVRQNQKPKAGIVCAGQQTRRSSVLSVERRKNKTLFTRQEMWPSDDTGIDNTPPSPVTLRYRQIDYTSVLQYHSARQK